MSHLPVYICSQVRQVMHVACNSWSNMKGSDQQINSFRYISLLQSFDILKPYLAWINVYEMVVADLRETAAG